MNTKIFLEDSERTMAPCPDGMLLTPGEASELLYEAQHAISSCRAIDGIKKELFYGASRVETSEDSAVSAEQYENIQKLDQREVNLLHAALGKLTEAGEVLENVFDYITSDKQNYDVLNTIEEVGDGLWYDAILLRDAGYSFEQVMQLNLNKLHARYPEKFDSTLAQNRDLERERRSLQDGDSTRG